MVLAQGARRPPADLGHGLNNLNRMVVATLVAMMAGSALRVILADSPDPEQKWLASSNPFIDGSRYVRDVADCLVASAGRDAAGRSRRGHRAGRRTC